MTTQTQEKTVAVEMSYVAFAANEPINLKAAVDFVLDALVTYGPGTRFYYAESEAHNVVGIIASPEPIENPNELFAQAYSEDTAEDKDTGGLHLG